MAFSTAERLRDNNIKTSLNIEGSSFKSQMKKADKSGAKIALIIGDEEADKNQIQVKFLRNEGLQCAVEVENISRYIKENL